MLYPYAEFPGELSITYSQIMVDDNVKGGKKLLVHFEQPTDYGFKEARYELPDYKEIYNYDFTPSETRNNLDILKKKRKSNLEVCRRGENKYLIIFGLKILL